MEPKLEIRHLKLLATVAATGSVTEAGKCLHLTQSALSHQLRDAEERLGTALFLRLGKKMVLTSAGETLLATTHRVLAELGDAEKLIAGTDGGSRGVIRLSTECYTSYHWLPPVMAGFHKKFPSVEIVVNVEQPESAVSSLLEGKLDVAITACTAPTKKLRQLLLFEDEMLVVMSPRHRLARVDYVKPEELEGETVLIYPPRGNSILLGEIMSPAGATPGRVTEIPLTEGMIELAAAGTGVALLASWAAEPAIRARKLVGKSVGAHGLRRQWYAFTLRSHPGPKYLQAFLESLKSASPFKKKRG